MVVSHDERYMTRQTLQDSQSVMKEAERLSGSRPGSMQERQAVQETWTCVVRRLLENRQQGGKNTN